MVQRARQDRAKIVTLGIGMVSADQFFRHAAMASGSLADALVNPTAIVGNAGLIVAANETWRSADREKGQLTLGTDGQNYLQALDTAAERGSQSARDAVDGLRSVLRRGSGQFCLEYEAITSDGTRRFAFMAASLAHLPGALITHRDVTERRKAEEALPGDYVAAGPLFETLIPALVKNLALALNMQNAFLAERLDDKRARILCHWTGQGFSEIYEYEIAGKPAELVLQGRTVAFPEALPSIYPDDSKEWRRAARSYIAAPVFDREGEAIGFLGGIDFKPIDDVPIAEAILRVFAAELTPELERRLAERRLAERFRILDSAPDAIIATNLDFLVTYWNREAERLYGWRAEEATGRVLGDVVGQFFTVPEREDARERVRAPGEHLLEVVHRRRDGSSVDIEARVTTLPDHAGGDSGLVFVCRDVTARRRAEDSLRLSAAREQAILSTIPDVIFTLDAQGTFLTFTPARGLTSLVPSSDFIGKRVVDVMPPELAERIMKAITACVRSAEVQTIEYELPKDGETRAYESRLALIAPGEVLAIVRDMTANRRLDSDSHESVGRKPMQGRTSPKILAIDHDKQALRFLKSTLELAGNKALFSSDLDEASSLVEIEEPDLVLLDLTVAGKERLQSCLDLWRLSGVSTVVMGTEEQEDEALRALRLGADDFIIKPLSRRELLARIEAALRRSRSMPNPASKPHQFGELTVDPWNRRVTVGGEPIRLTATEFRLLVELAQANGRLLTHDEILERVWGAGYAGQNDLVRAYVRSLRRKLRDDARHPRYVLVERGAGYRMPPATS